MQHIVQPDPPGYSRVAIALHWLLAALLFYQLALGWWMGDLPRSPPELRAGWYNWHKSIGMTIALLVIVRLAWRSQHPVPQLETLPAWQQRAAAWGHAGLYICMVVMPLSGFIGSVFGTSPLRFFDLPIPLSHPWRAAREAMGLVHGVTAALFMALIAVHVAAALWHWWRRDGVARRMGLPEGDEQ